MRAPRKGGPFEEEDRAIVLGVLLMRCNVCKNWTTARVTRYGDGSEVVNWRAPEGKGECGELGINTPAEFGCVQFAALANGNASVPATVVPHVASSWKNGAPWQHYVYGPCPQCRGRGSFDPGGVCMTCAGTGKVRYYDDGYIGEELTKLHPKEKENTEPLKCRNCSEIVDIKWKACPMCGTRLEPMAETEYVDGLGNAGGVFKSNGREQRADTLRRDIEEMNERDAKIATMRRMTVENGCSEEEAKVAAAMADRMEAAVEKPRHSPGGAIV